MVCDECLYRKYSSMSTCYVYSAKKPDRVLKGEECRYRRPDSENEAGSTKCNE